MSRWRVSIWAPMSQRFCLDFAGGDFVFISGSGRSGTSWLANLCNYRNDFRYMFEPLNPAHLKTTTPRIDWLTPPNHSNTYLSKVCRGDVSTPWVNSRNKRVIARRRLIKEVRSNLNLPWIKHNFPQSRLVLALRNPLAVAASRILLHKFDRTSRWEWHPNLDALMSIEEVREALNSSQKARISKLTADEFVAQSIIDWCLHNLLFWERIGESVDSVIYYEDMILNPEPTAKKLLSSLSIDWSGEDLLPILEKNSETTRRPIDAVDVMNDQRLNSWKTVLTPEEIEVSLEILQLFDFERLYDEKLRPANPSTFTRQRR